MSKAAWIISFKLNQNISQEVFMEATQKLHDEVVSKAQGFLSWEQYLQDDIWTDFVVWETLKDANNATSLGQGTEAAERFYSMLQMDSCKMLISSLVKRY